MNALLVLLCLWGASAFFTLGLVAAKEDLLSTSQSLWRYARAVLAPVFVVSELRSFGKVRLQVREDHRADLLMVMERRLNRYPDRDLREHLLYLLQLLDASQSLRHWVLSADRTESIVATRVRDAVLPGTDLVEFVGYMAAAAGMSPQEGLELAERLRKCYESKRLMPRSSSILN